MDIKPLSGSEAQVDLDPAFDMQIEVLSFFEAHSFRRTLLSENCSRLGTDNVRGQIAEHISS